MSAASGSFRVLKPITSRADQPHAVGAVKHAAEFDGCDIGWLVRVGALEPINPNSVTKLYGANPTAEDYAEEINRLQGVIESQQALIDGQAATIAELRQANPVPVGMAARLAEDPSALATAHPSVGTPKGGMNPAAVPAPMPRVARFADSQAGELIDPALLKQFPHLAARTGGATPAFDDGAAAAQADELAAAKRKIAELTAKLDAK